MVPHLALAWMVSGAIAGMLAGAFLGKSDHGPAGDILTGMVGSLLGGLVAAHLHIRIRIGSHTTTALVLGFVAGVCLVVMTRARAWHRMKL